MLAYNQSLLARDWPRLDTAPAGIFADIIERTRHYITITRPLTPHPVLTTQCCIGKAVNKKRLDCSNNISKKNILNRPIENVSNKNNWIFWNWQILERINLIVGFLQQQNPESEVLGRYSCMDPNIDIYKWSDLLERAQGTSQLWPWLAKVLSFFINISILFLRCFSLIFLA